MPVTLRQLEIFITVAETQQVTRASKQLLLSQSAISMAVGELEKQLDAPLFDRYGRCLQLNDRGRYLLPKAKDILRRVQNVESILTEKNKVTAGSLEIAASSTIGNYVLPILIGAFMKLHPESRINMLIADTGQAEKLVSQGAIDLGFVEGCINNEQLKETPWLEDQLVAVVSHLHPLAAQDNLRIPDDLQKTAWLMPEDDAGTADFFKNKLGKHADRLKVVTRMGQTEAIKRAIESGAGAACLSELSVLREIEQGRLHKLTIDSMNMRRVLRIIRHQDKVPTRLMNKFLLFCNNIKGLKSTIMYGLKN